MEYQENLTDYIVQSINGANITKINMQHINRTPRHNYNLATPSPSQVCFHHQAMDSASLLSTLSDTQYFDSASQRKHLNPDHYNHEQYCISYNTDANQDQIPNHSSEGNMKIKFLNGSLVLLFSFCLFDLGSTSKLISEYIVPA